MSAPLTTRQRPRRPLARTPSPTSPSTPSPRSATRCRPTARASASRWPARSSRPCRWRSPASCAWPDARRTRGPRSPRPSRGRTRWVRARPGPAARPTPCCRPTGSAPGCRGASCRRPRWPPGCRPQAVASFAELVFAYIDELSAASVAGHTDELETSGRVRQRYLDRLAVGLLRGEPAGRPDAGGRAGRLEAAADADRRAAARGAGRGRCSGWCRAERCSPGRAAGPARGGAGRGAGARHGGPLPRPAAPGARRPARRRRAGPAVAGGAGVVRPGGAGRWPLRRTRGAGRHRAPPRGAGASAPTPRRWPTCARAALAPLADVRPATAEKLEATLRSWLLHQGRREDVAADLFVHPQTVRYRMGQLRELYGDRLEDPQTVLALTLALA